MPQRAFFAALFTLCLVACSHEETSTAQTSSTPLIACQNPRPEICTFEYNPVCGQRDTGIRCVTTPCPSTEWQTFGNACTACGDPAVAGYYPGECAEYKK